MNMNIKTIKDSVNVADLIFYLDRGYKILLKGNNLDNVSKYFSENVLKYADNKFLTHTYIISDYEGEQWKNNPFSQVGICYSNDTLEMDSNVNYVVATIKYGRVSSLKLNKTKELQTV